MNFKLSKHAIERMDQRGIKQNQVKIVLETPDSIDEVDDCKHVYQKLIKENIQNICIEFF